MTLSGHSETRQNFLSQQLHRLRQDQRGVAATEYATMLVLISLAVATLGGNSGIDTAITGVFRFVLNTLVGA